MPRARLSLFFLLVGAAGGSAAVTQYVNPFTGTNSVAQDFGTGGGAGNTFPGAVAPFGMLQWSPDTFPSVDNFAGGYTYTDTQIRGFSLTHLSGAGCAIFQDVPLLPTTVLVTKSPSVAGTYDVDPDFVPSFTHSDEAAEPGYYQVRLNPASAQPINVELAARTRTALGRLTFPATTDASLLVNAGGSGMANGEVAFAIDPLTQEISGAVAAGQFCYQRNQYRLYFALRFSRPFAAYGTWQDQTLTPGGTESAQHTDRPIHFRVPPSFGTPSHASNTAQAGAYVTFDASIDPIVVVRVGISFASVEGARANLATESPDFDFDAARAESRATWDELLGRIEVSGGALASTRTFYTMLYHALLAPTVFSDVDGAYVGMDGQAHTLASGPKYANFSGWDIYRGEIPLLALLEPARTSAMIQSLLIDAAESGWLPRWPVANGQTDVMVGDPAAAMIASAHAFGAHNFDTAAALAAMRRGATEVGTSPNGGYVERQGLADYLRLGYVPHDGTEKSNGGSTSLFGSTSGVWGSAATTLEYAAADFALARFAAALGDRATYRAFMRRTGNWRKLFNPASGYIHPRYASGAFKTDFDPRSLEGFAEGNAAQYTWAVPFDPAGLIARLGGREKASQRLDAHFQQLNEGPESEYAFLGNEPELGVPWLYDWLGQPYKTQRVVRVAVRTLFNDSPGGYAGNDDLGAMSAWYVFAAMGLYPAVPGVELLALGSPLFPEITLHLAAGDVTISASGAAEDRPYVQRLMMNGKRHEQPWLTFSAIRCGAALVFELGDTPNPRWGSRRAQAPPSFPPNRRFPRPTSSGPCPAMTVKAKP